MEVPPTIEKVVEDKEEEEGAVDPVSDAAIAKEVETKLEINNDEEEALESEKPNEGEIEEMDSKKAQKAVSVVPVDEPQEVEDAKKEGVILDEALEETKKEKEEKVEVEEASKETTCEKSDDEQIVLCYVVLLGQTIFKLVECTTWFYVVLLVVYFLLSMI